MSTAREVVIETMRTSGLDEYVNRAEPVIDALDDRDEEIANALIGEGVSMGGNESAIRNLMIEVGLLPEPEAVSSNGTSQAADEDRLTRLEGMVERLVRAAESRGLRV